VALLSGPALFFALLVAGFFLVAGVALTAESYHARRSRSRDRCRVRESRSKSLRAGPKVEEED
jgi:hypothetical protein